MIVGASCRGRRLDRLWRSRRSVACTIATNGALRNRWQLGPCRSLTSRTATCLAQGGHLSAQRLDQPADITDQRPRHRARGRDCGLWAAVFAANASSIAFWRRTAVQYAAMNASGGNIVRKRGVQLLLVILIGLTAILL